MDGALQEQQKSAEDARDDGAEERDDVEHEDDDADEGGVLDLQQQAADEAQDRDDERVDDLSHEEAVEHLVGEVHLVLDDVGPLLRDDAVEDEPGLGGEATAAREHVDADEDAEEQVRHHGDGVEHVVAHA